MICSILLWCQESDFSVISIKKSVLASGAGDHRYAYLLIWVFQKTKILDFWLTLFFPVQKYAKNSTKNFWAQKNVVWPLPGHPPAYPLFRPTPKHIKISTFSNIVMLYTIGKEISCWTKNLLTPCLQNVHIKSYKHFSGRDFMLRDPFSAKNCPLMANIFQNSLN